jgi:Protein of unknown function (DUF3750)
MLLSTLLLLLLIFVPLGIKAYLATREPWPTWRDANWSTANLAPDPRATPEAVVQVYAAPAGRWRGIFSVHSWIAYKRAEDRAYARYDVVGWGTPVRRNSFDPDGHWFGNLPEIMVDLRGERAARLIPDIEAAIKAYPYAVPGSYRVWPGPNSNSFIAYIGRRVPQLGLRLPPNSLGKDFLGGWRIVDRTPSGTGFQVSLLGVIGFSVGLVEGLELNLLGATIGIDLLRPALKLPGLGRLGMAAA